MSGKMQAALGAGVLAVLGSAAAFWAYEQMGKGSKKRIKRAAGRLMTEMEAAAEKVCAKMK